jgi:hypothetical protein
LSGTLDGARRLGLTKPDVGEGFTPSRSPLDALLKL